MIFWCKKTETKRRKSLFLREESNFFLEKCTSYQNFAYFCTVNVDLLLRDLSLKSAFHLMEYPIYQQFITIKVISGKL